MSGGFNVLETTITDQSYVVVPQASANLWAVSENLRTGKGNTAREHSFLVMGILLGVLTRDSGSIQCRAPQLPASSTAPACTASHASCLLSDKLVLPRTAMVPEDQAVYIQLSLLFHKPSLDICYELDTVERGGHGDEGQEVSGGCQ